MSVLQEVEIIQQALSNLTKEVSILHKFLSLKYEADFQQFYNGEMTLDQNFYATEVFIKSEVEEGNFIDEAGFCDDDNFNLRPETGGIAILGNANLDIDDPLSNEGDSATVTVLGKRKRPSYKKHCSNSSSISSSSGDNKFKRSLKSRPASEPQQHKEEPRMCKCNVSDNSSSLINLGPASPEHEPIYGPRRLDFRRKKLTSKFVCPICFLVFGYQQATTQHSMEEHWDRTGTHEGFLCVLPDCNLRVNKDLKDVKRFPRIGDFREHIRTYHKWTNVTERPALMTLY